jgi:hypothetical protein
VLHSYSLTGGNIMLSGSYIGSDMDTPGDVSFSRRVLKYKFGGSYQASDSITAVKGNGLKINFISKMNDEIYTVNRPEILIPCDRAIPMMLYPNGKTAAIFYNGKNFRTFCMGFPFEVIQDETVRDRLMTKMLRIFERKR